MNKKITQEGLAVAAVVGTVLLLINQYDALFGDADIRLIPAILTYCVPFVVFLAGARKSKQVDKEKRH